MRKLYFLLILFTTSTGFAFSPPVINQPTDLKACDTNNDGHEVFDLTTKVSEILGALNPSLYTVTFHETATDSELGFNAVPANAYVNITSVSQTIWVRVRENATEDYSITVLTIKAVPSVLGEIITPSQTLCGASEAVITFQATGGEPPYLFLYRINGGLLYGVQSNFGNTAELVVPGDIGPAHVELEQMHTLANELPGCNQIANTSVDINYMPLPNAGMPQNIVIAQNPYIGVANFDLTTNTLLLLNGDPTLTVQYYDSVLDAEAEVNAIANPASFYANNGQMIFARVENATAGCYVLRSFGLYTTNPDIVFIPDANFKQRLLIADAATQVAQDLNNNFTDIDLNDDGEIQYSEVGNISLLNIGSSNIADLTGLEAFVNLKYLDAGYNSQLTTIPTTALPLLETLSATHCSLTSLDLSNNTNLKSVSLEFNMLTSLDFSQCPLLTFIHCQSNQLTNLNLTGLTQLTNLWASDNNLTSLNTADLNSILYFNMEFNELTTLDLTGMTTIEELLLNYNQIDSINTAGCTALTSLVCSNNNMSFLEVSESTELSDLDCRINDIVNLDLSNNSLLCALNCSLNPQLVTLNLKNGVDSCYGNFNVSAIEDNLLLFCCDDNEVAYFKNYFTTHGAPNVNVNSYCSFTPGGDYNTINLNAKFDASNNGCDVSDNAYPNVRLNINDGTNSGATFTDSDGNAKFFTQAGNFTITPAVENPSWFTISPSSAAIPFANTNNNTVNQNFCITANGVHPDLEIVIAPLTSARPGFDADYKIVVRNKGNQTLSQDVGILFVYPFSYMTLVSSELPFASSGPGVLHMDLDPIAPFESRSNVIKMNVNAPTHPTAPVNIGTVFHFTAGVEPMTNDETIPDNTFNLNQTVIGSYDPNEIVCLEGNVVSPIEIGNYLHYVINFENTGNADAENIVVRELIDTTQFDVSTLQLLNSSASVTTRLTGNLAEFIFPSINLHSGGHGNILLKIRSNTTLTEGDMVSKTANIYFDYNFPVETQPEDTVFQTLSNPDMGIDASVSIYPNPTKGLINIECNNTIKSVQLYDIQGRILQTNLVNENQASFDMSMQSKGIYFIKIISDNGMKVQKIVRE